MDKVSRRPIGSAPISSGGTASDPSQQQQPPLPTASKTPNKSSNKKDRDSLVVPSSIITTNNDAHRPPPPKRTPSNIAASSPGSASLFGGLIQNFLPSHVRPTKSGALKFRDRTDVTAKRGFRVQLPKRMLVNTILVFLVMPIILFLYKEKDIHKEHADLSQHMTKSSNDEKQQIAGDSSSTHKPKKESLTQLLGLDAIEEVNEQSNSNNNTQESAAGVPLDDKGAPHEPPEKLEAPQNNDLTAEKQQSDNAAANTNTNENAAESPDGGAAAAGNSDNEQKENPAGAAEPAAGAEDQSQQQQDQVNDNAQQNADQQPIDEGDQPVEAGGAFVG